MTLINSFTPTAGNAFQVLTFGSVTGGLDSITGIHLGTALVLDPVLAATSLTLTATTVTVAGTTGDDTLTGTTGNDVISGGVGTDVLSGGAGDDLLFGGAGTDTGDYSLASAVVTVDLGNALRQVIGADQGTDLLNGIENLIGGAFADTLSGDDGANTLTGGAGSDTLSGRAGADVYRYIATADGSTTPGQGDVIASANFVSGADAFNFLASAFGDAGLAGTVAITGVLFSVDQTTTLAALTTAAGVDAEAFFVKLTGSTLDSTLFDAIDTALAAGVAATGQGFLIADNGTDTKILFDNDFATAGAGSLVEVATIQGLADGGAIVSDQDLVIVAS